MNKITLLESILDRATNTSRRRSTVEECCGATEAYIKLLIANAIAKVGAHTLATSLSNDATILFNKKSEKDDKPLIDDKGDVHHYLLGLLNARLHQTVDGIFNYSVSEHPSAIYRLK